MFWFYRLNVKCWLHVLILDDTVSVYYSEHHMRNYFTIALKRKLVASCKAILIHFIFEYLNKYCNDSVLILRLVAKLEETSPDQVDVFKTNMNKVMKDILGRFKELQFFTGESMDIDGMVALLEYREIDGDSVPVLMFFKHGLLEEKF